VIASTEAFIKYSYKRRDACGVDISTRGGTERERKRANGCGVRTARQ